MLDAGIDQAAGLRQRMGAAAQPHAGTLEATAASGLGVMYFPSQGKGTDLWVARLAQGLRAHGARPVVLDAAGGGMLARAMGAAVRLDMLAMLEGRAEFDEVSRKTRGGVHVLRADGGVEAFAATGAPPGQLFRGFGHLSHGFDTVLLVMPAGELACLATPASSVPIIAMHGGSQGLMRAYGLVKQLAAGFGYRRFAVVACTANARQAHDAHGRLSGAARAFLDVDTTLAGTLPDAGIEPHGAGAARLRELVATLLATAASRFDKDSSALPEPISN